MIADIASERAVLAGLCQHGLETLLDVDYLEQQHFTDSSNQLIFECVKSTLVDGNKIELSSILSKANELGCAALLEKTDEIAFIRSLFNMPILRENIPTYASKLAKLKLIRDLRKTLRACDTKLSEATGSEDILNLLETVEAPLQDLISSVYNTSENKPVKLGDGISDYLTHLIDNPVEMVGISTGYPEFDMAIGGGLRRKCVDIVGARMKVGKTLFGENVAVSVAGRDIPVLMLDTEMDEKGHIHRILASMSNVTIDDIQTGKFGSETMKETRVRNAGRRLEEMPFYYQNVSGKSFDSIVSIMKQWLFKEVGFNEDGSTKDCLIIYDYIKIMDSDDLSESVREHQALGFQLTALHNFCVKYDVPCLTFVQLNRDGIGKESTDAAADSDRILRYCTSFSIFKVKSPEEQADDRSWGAQVPYNRKLVPIICRYGGGLSDGDYINIMMKGEFGLLVPGPTKINFKKQSNTTIEKHDNKPTDIATV